MFDVTFVFFKQIINLFIRKKLFQNYCSSSGPTTISSGRGAFQPFHSSRDPTSSTQSYSPDSSTNDVTPIDYSVHGTIHTGYLFI